MKKAPTKVKDKAGDIKTAHRANENMKTIKGFECPTNARKLVHVWQDRKSVPLIKKITV